MATITFHTSAIGHPCAPSAIRGREEGRINRRMTAREPRNIMEGSRPLRRRQSWPSARTLIAAKNPLFRPILYAAAVAVRNKKYRHPALRLGSKSDP